MAGRVIDEATRARARASSGKRILGQLANARDVLSRVADGQALQPGAFGSRKSTAIGAGVDSALNDALAEMTDTHAQRVAAALAAVGGLGGVYLMGRAAGRDAAVTEHLKARIEAERARQGVDDEARRLGDRDLCVRLGGLRADCERL